MIQRELPSDFSGFLCKFNYFMVRNLGDNFGVPINSARIDDLSPMFGFTAFFLQVLQKQMDLPADTNLKYRKTAYMVFHEKGFSHEDINGAGDRMSAAKTVCEQVYARETSEDVFEKLAICLVKLYKIRPSEHTTARLADKLKFITDLIQNGNWDRF